MVLEYKEDITVDKIINTLTTLNYIVFNDKLNLGVIRSEYQTAGKFDDVLYCFYTDSNNQIQFFCGAGTADPSDFYLNNPLSPIGCAILPFGQHIDKWCKGQHKTYTALVQCKDLTIIRDYNKDGSLHYDKPDYDACKQQNNEYNTVRTYYKNNVKVWCEETGIFGLDIHHAAAYSVVPTVGLYSAGCQVWQYIGDFNKMMDSVTKVPQDRYSYTVLYEPEYLKYCDGTPKDDVDDDTSFLNVDDDGKIIPTRTVVPSNVTPIIDTPVVPDDVTFRFGVRSELSNIGNDDSNSIV